MPELLPNRHVLANMIPVMIDHALHQRSKGKIPFLPVDDEVILSLEPFGRERVEPWIGSAGDRVPGGPHVAERRGAGRPTRRKLLVDLGQEDLVLPAPQPVALLLPGEMADVPTDAVHGADAAARVGVAKTFKRALPFAARKAQLYHEWVRHTRCSC